jgi:hypothetical protein
MSKSKKNAKQENEARMEAESTVRLSRAVLAPLCFQVSPRNLRFPLGCIFRPTVFRNFSSIIFPIKFIDLAHQIDSPSHFLTQEKKIVLQMLDGQLHPHTGPAIAQYNGLSRLVFGPAGSLVFARCCGGKKKDLQHETLWSFPEVEAYNVWKQFKPNWEEERTAPEYVISRHELRNCFCVRSVFSNAFTLSTPI